MCDSTSTLGGIRTTKTLRPPYGTFVSTSKIHPSLDIVFSRVTLVFPVSASSSSYPSIPLFPFNTIITTYSAFILVSVRFIITPVRLTSKRVSLEGTCIYLVACILQRSFVLLLVLLPKVNRHPGFSFSHLLVNLPEPGSSRHCPSSLCSGSCHTTSETLPGGWLCLLSELLVRPRRNVGNERAIEGNDLVLELPNA